MTEAAQINPELEEAVDDGFLRLVMDFALKAYDTTELAMQSDRMHRHLADARALFVWAVKTYRPNISYSVIGTWLGGREVRGLIVIHREAEARRASSMSFDRNCSDFAQLMRHRMEVPHGCA